jgi:hypothetical protein
MNKLDAVRTEKPVLAPLATVTMAWLVAKV